jgi:hypothetical protein
MNVELHRTSSAALIAAALIACRPASQPQSSEAPYLVTETALDVGTGIRLCLAVDSRRQDGVWWWEPGRSGCASRSTGPGLFHPDDARVSSGVAATSIGFRLGTHSLARPFIDVRLEAIDGTMRSLESGARVSLQRWKKLDVPELP